MSTFDNLNETFDIEPTEPVKIERAPKKPSAITDKGVDREKDYQYARGQLYNIVEKMQESLDGAMEVAQDTSHPRAWEVAMQGAKHTADVVDKLVALHNSHKKLDEDAVASANPQMMGGTQNNIFFSGSTQQMMELIKETNQKSPEGL